MTSERIDTMEDAEIEELNARYEARLGAAMSKSLGSTLLRLMQARRQSFYPYLFLGSLSSWLTLNRIHSLAVLYRALAVSYTITTVCI